MSDKNKQIEEQAMKTSELLPCPFCGGDNVGIWHFQLFAHSFEVRCYDCHFGLEQRSTREEAISAWNTRKPIERIVERLEEESHTAKTKPTDLGFVNEYKWVFLKEAIEIVKEVGA